VNFFGETSKADWLRPLVIVVMHLTILGGGFLMLALRSPVWGLLLLVALKTALDLRGHFAERKKFAETTAP
jgi:hypothetical protein